MIEMASFDEQSGDGSYSVCLGLLVRNDLAGPSRDHFKDRRSHRNSIGL